MTTFASGWTLRKLPNREQQARRAGWRHPGSVEGLRLDTIWNPQFKVHLAAAQRFLREQHRWVTATEGAAPRRLKVRNGGTLTATGVRVRVLAPRHVAMHRPDGFGVQPRRFPHPEIFSGVPVERDRDDLTFYGVAGNGPGAPDVEPGGGVAEFSWSRVQQDASVLSLPLWITAGQDASVGRAALRLEVLCEEIGGGSRVTWRSRSSIRRTRHEQGAGLRGRWHLPGPVRLT